jgi:isopentenyl phosphate kinase
MLLVKFGGSVITVKSKYRTLRAADLSRLARELAAAHDPEAGTVLVHGAGSFGHILAAKHRLKEGFHDSTQLAAVAQVQRDVRALDLEVLDALLKARLRPISIPPGTDAYVDQNGTFQDRKSVV